MTHDYGIVAHNGEALTITAAPEATNHRDTIRYIAPAVDALGNTYRVEWDVTGPDWTDEERACDWYNPSRITKD